MAKQIKESYAKTLRPKDNSSMDRKEKFRVFGASCEPITSPQFSVFQTLVAALLPGGICLKKLCNLKMLTSKPSNSKKIIGLLSYLILLALSIPAAYGNTDSPSEWRTWTSTAGTTLEARLIEVKPDSVVLENRDGRQLTVQLSQLAEQDRKFTTVRPPEKGNTQIEGLDAVPGVISEPIVCENDAKWSYHLYLPKEFHDGRKWPVWFIMSPVGAESMDDLRRYIDGAEQLGCILALSVESRNDFHESELAVEAMIEDVFERLPVTSGLAFTTGFSGGSRIAYLTAERDQRIAGVLACGSGRGVYPKDEKFRPAKIRNNTYVYSLIGTNCCNRTGATKSHLEFPEDYRLRFFPGGHVWADSEYLSQGMARVLGAGLERKKGNAYEKMRGQFAQTMLDWAKSNEEKTPWETYYWANYLQKFPSNNTIVEEAQLLAGQLETNLRVQSAIKAENMLRKFIEAYFKSGDKADQIDKIRRKKDAERLAETYKDLPYGTLFRRLGEPCDY